MKLKRLFLLIVASFLCLSAVAQVDKDRYMPRGEIFHSEDTSVVNGRKGVGWVRNHLLDDWFLQLQGGGQLYYGTDDREGLFGDRLTANGEFHLGRRIFPMFGFRLNMGYGYAHGFLTRDHYNQYWQSIESHGFSGQCDPKYCGYYWDYDKNSDLLIQKWKYLYYGVDLFMDLALFRGAKNYNPYRHWNHILYMGVDNRNALSETDTTNHRTEGHLGYIAKYNFTSNWSIYADARISFIERLFDREWMPELESAGVGLDAVANLQVGVTYKFHVRTKDERDYFRTQQRTTIDTHNVTHFFYVRMRDTNYTAIYDTTISKNIYDTVPTAGMQDTIFWLTNDIKRWQALLDGGDPQNGLDTGTLSLILPYEQVFFERDKWDILPSEESKIRKMAQIMEAYPDTKYILIGSADSKTGTVKRNIFLGHVRADVVYNSLVTEYGIDSTRLSREYKGGILDYQPFELNRSTVILMDHPYVRKLFLEMKSKGQAGGRDVKIEN